MIAQFALRLICGMSLMWSIMPRSRVTSGFFRIQMLVTLGLSVLASLTIGQFLGNSSGGDSVLGPQWTWIACLILAGGSFLGSIVWTLDRRKVGNFFVLGIASLSIVTLLFSTVSPEMLSKGTGWLHLFSELSTASMLGGAVTAMLLGHWYLTAPTMSIAPLTRLTLYLGIAAVIRLAISAVGLVVAQGELAGQTYWIWLSLRWLAGIIGPLIVVVMVWRILKYRNTQSATGVLFAGVILTFIGELTASLLFRELQMPL